MATFQSKNFRAQIPPVSRIRGNLMVAVFTATVDKPYVAGTSDLIELGTIPMSHQVHRAEVTTANVGEVATLDVGIMTGTPGDLVSARTMAATGEIVEAGAKNTTIAVAPAALAAILPQDRDVSIGLRFSADVAAAANKAITVRIEYYAV